MNTSKNKKLFNNIVTSLFGLTILTMVISLIGSALGWQAAYTKINSVTGILERNIIVVTNLFGGSEIKNILGNVMVNFVTFAPLGAFLIALIGVMVAYKSGLLVIIFTIIGKYFNKFWLTFTVVMLAILSTFMSDAGYVILIPLAAIFYLVNNRNPLVGILATFVGVSAGQSINFLLSSLENDLMPYTDLAAKLTDNNFAIKSYGNIFFCIIAVISLAFLITYITEKIIIPRIPKYRRDEEIIEEVTIGRREKRGLLLSSIGASILIIIFTYMLIPGLSGSGLLLDGSETKYINMLFGANSSFNSTIVFLMATVLLIAGILYGLGAKTIRNKEQLSSMLYESLNNIGGVLLLIFVISQFIAIFKRSNLGTVICVWLIELIKTLNFTSVPLILLVFIFMCIANMFLTSPVTKWAILSPIAVPLFMNANMTAEFSQAVYRVSLCATNILTPLSAYFIIFIGYLEMYNKGEKRISFRDCYKMLWPYGLAIALLWIFVLVAWYIIGLPIGLGVYPTV